MAIELPKIQFFHTIEGFMVILCLFTAIQSMIISGMVPGVVTSIEKRYGLSSTQSGTILQAYGLAKMLFTIPLSYIAGKGHMPHFLGYATLITAMSSLLFALPHFVTPPYSPSQSGFDGLCGNDPTALQCNGEKEVDVFGIFYVALFINGMAAGLLYTTGSSYIEQNAPKNKRSVYMGIFGAMVGLGPLIGYFLTGGLLNAYVESEPAPIGLDSNSINWVGRWWASFIIGMVLCLLISPFWFFIPAKLELQDEEERNEVELQSDKTSNTSPSISFRDAFDMIKLIILNPIWIFTTFAETSEMFNTTGWSGYGSKYLQTQTDMSASTASFLIGASVVPAIVIGAVLGGWWIEKFHRTLLHTSRFNAKAAIGAIIPIIILGSISCQTPSIVGLNEAYNPTKTIDFKNLSNICNIDCICPNIFDPVCGSDMRSYYSACHAGCAQIKEIGSSYANCSCVGFDIMDFSISTERTVSTGMCDTTCKSTGLILIGFFLFLFLTFFNSTSATIVIMRSVPPSHIALAIAANDVILKIGGLIAPITFGLVFDNSCLDKGSHCGDNSCAIYDKPRIRNTLFFGTSLVTKLGTIICFVIASYYINKVPILSVLEKESDEKSSQDSAPKTTT